MRKNRSTRVFISAGVVWACGRSERTVRGTFLATKIYRPTLSTVQRRLWRRGKLLRAFAPDRSDHGREIRDLAPSFVVADNIYRIRILQRYQPTLAEIVNVVTHQNRPLSLPVAVYAPADEPQPPRRPDCEPSDRPGKPAAAGPAGGWSGNTGGRGVCPSWVVIRN